MPSDFNYSGSIVTKRIFDLEVTMSDAISANIKALAFDTGGTVFNWHDSLVKAFVAVGARRNVSVDWHEVANDWRRRSLQHVLGMEQPDGQTDDVHRHVLDRTLAEFGLNDFTSEDRAQVLGPGTSWTRGRTPPPQLPGYGQPIRWFR